MRFLSGASSGREAAAARRASSRVVLSPCCSLPERPSARRSSRASARHSVRSCPDRRHRGSTVPSRTTQSRSAVASIRWRSWLMRITAPSYSLRPWISASRLSTSRWLVGSSRISRCGAWKVASVNSSRAFSPPESFRPRVSAFSWPKPVAASAGALLRLGLVRHQLGDVLVGRALPGSARRADAGRNSRSQLLGGAAYRPTCGSSRPQSSLAKRRFAVAVGAEQADAVVGVEPQIETAQHGPVRRIADARILRAEISGLPSLPCGLGKRKGTHVVCRSRRRWAASSPAPSAGSAPAVALDALARNRSTNSSICWRASSCFFFSLSCRRCRLAPRFLERVIAAGIERQLAVRQMQDRSRRIC